jgi:hypothetical protein
MRRYPNLQALLLSFASADVYRDAARHWRGAGMIYLLTLAAVMTVLLVIKMHVAIDRVATREAPPLISQLPRITVHKGEVSVDVRTPYVIHAPETGKEVAIIDTSGTVTSLEGLEALALLTRRSVMVRRNNAETRVFDLSSVEHFELGPERAGRWARAAAAWLAPLCAPFILAGVYLLRLFQALIAAGLLLLVASVQRVKLDFAAAMRVAALAITPPTLLLDGVGFFGVKIPFSTFLWIGLCVAWMMFAVRALVRSEAPADTAPIAPAH